MTMYDPDNEQHLNYLERHRQTMAKISPEAASHFRAGKGDPIETPVEPTDEQLREFGWAPGGYTVRCIDCDPHIKMGENGCGAKRSLRCKAHAIAAFHKPPPSVRPISEPGPISILSGPQLKLEQRHADFAEKFRRGIGGKYDRDVESVAWALYQYEHDITVKHYAHVTELIRACSTEVIKRRVLKAKLDYCLTLLDKLRTVLRRYARHHRDKHTLEAAQKAEVNDQLADEIDAAFCYDPDPADYGKA